MRAGLRVRQSRRLLCPPEMKTFNRAIALAGITGALFAYHALHWPRSPDTVNPVDLSQKGNEQKVSSRVELETYEKLSAVLELRRRGEFPGRFSCVDTTGRLSPSFIEVFELSASEQSDLVAAIEEARASLAQIEGNRRRVLDSDKSAFVVEIPAFPELGGVVYDRLMAAFAAVLGAERYSAFQDVGAEQVEQTFGGHFGCDAVTVTIYKEGPVGRSGYRASEVTETIGGRSPSRMWKFGSRSEIAREIGPVAALLPPDF